MAASQLFQRLSGKITSAAPEMPRRMRKAVHARSSRRRRKSFGTRRTRAKRAPMTRLRSRMLTVSVEAAEVAVVFMRALYYSPKETKQAVNILFKYFFYKHTRSGQAEEPARQPKNPTVSD